MNIKAHLITLGIILSVILFFGLAVTYPLQFMLTTSGVLVVVGIPLLYWHAYKWINSYFGE